MPEIRTELLNKLEHLGTSHRRRFEIGEQLERQGDPRPGTGVKHNLPDIVWLPVTPGGTVNVTRVWEPETPDEERRLLHQQEFGVAPFYIAKYLVTYAQYEAFIKAKDGFDNPTWWRGMPTSHQPQSLVEQRTKKMNNPRDSVSWYQSVAFARWLHHQLQGLEMAHPSGEDEFLVGENAQVRLPTEWEWQWAAQNGAEGRVYPWGDVNTGFANTVEAELKQSIAVGMYPHGAAGCGALDMAGNLMEWCLNNKKPLEIVNAESSAPKVLRGGDWGYGIEISRCAYCDGEDPARIDALNGFRLVLGTPLEHPSTS